MVLGLFSESSQLSNEVRHVVVSFSRQVNDILMLEYQIVNVTNMKKTNAVKCALNHNCIFYECMVREMLINVVFYYLNVAF